MNKPMHDGLPVAGYRPQTADAVAVVNHTKQLEETILRHLDYLEGVEPTDRHWLALGRAAIEQGFMSVNRAVFKPARVALPGDSE